MLSVIRSESSNKASLNGRRSAPHKTSKDCLHSSPCFYGLNLEFTSDNAVYVHFRNHVQKVERASVEEIHTDFQKWLEVRVNIYSVFVSVNPKSHWSILCYISWQVLGAQCESYQGDEVLGHNEALEKAVSVQDRWLDMCIQLLRQHSSPDSAQSEHYHGFTELQIVLSELHKHLTDHITGENGEDFVTTTTWATFRKGFLFFTCKLVCCFRDSQSASVTVSVHRVLDFQTG